MKSRRLPLMALAVLTLTLAPAAPLPAGFLLGVLAVLIWREP